MDIFVARQPIFDRNQKIISYELLFRSNGDNYYNATDGDGATLDVITNSFTLIGLKNLTNNKKAFINFTEGLILKGTPLLLPKDKIVIEILETVSPTRELIECCKNLKNMGYVLALDDFVFSLAYKPLMELADIIKVDFLATKGKDRAEIMKKVSNPAVRFLAEKVETIGEFEEAVKLGYSYFQGYFFSRPTILTSKEIPVNKLYNFQIIKFIYEGSDELDELEEVIKKDVSLSYKLLRYINSASFGFKRNIQSIRQALVLMGKRELVKWITIVTLRSFIDKQNEAIMDAAVVRAKFGEMIANSINLKNRASEVFIMGMFSNIDALLNMPMEQALVDIPIAEDIKLALLGNNNIFKGIIDLILSYEKADWETFSNISKNLNISEMKVATMYTEALEWSTKLISV
jgi:EAL and modified HD-GYP domain-containing signal transduction protein